MEQQFEGMNYAFYTVKQLSTLFGKSEDTIRRWKNEGIGREDDNIKLRAIEREDGSGRKNARHLVFSREAVIEFVKANPFLMDDAPQLSLMMQAEDAWRGGSIPLPGAVSSAAENERERTTTGFMAQVRRLTEEAFGSDFDGDDDFSDEIEPRGSVYTQSREDWQLPRFERRSPGGGDGRPSFTRAESARERVRRRIFGEDDIDEYGGEAPFGDEPFRRAHSAFEDDDFDFDQMDNSGWKKPMPRPGPGQRQAIDAEFQRRMKTIRFGLEVIAKERGALEAQRQELEKVMENVRRSGMDGLSIASVVTVMEQKMATLAEQMDMLEEFTDVLEAELKED